MTELSKDTERILEEHFPKGHKSRGAAILLIAVARTDLRIFLEEEKKKIKRLQEGSNDSGGIADALRFGIATAKETLIADIETHFDLGFSEEVIQ